MKRRSALGKIASTLTAGMWLPSLPAIFSACEPDDPGPQIRYDGTVAVIGAGIAGLYVADILRSKGIQTRVYEASDRVGGRVRSLRASEASPVKTDFPIELGAERIYGSNSKWYEIITQRNIPLVDISDPNTNYFILEQNLQSLTEILSEADFAGASSFVENLGDQAISNLSVQQAIQAASLPERVHGILNALIGNRYGTDNLRLGIAGLVESLRLLQRDLKEFVLTKNPMQDMVTSRFSAAVELTELNTILTGIDYSGSKVILQGTRGGAPFSEEVDKVVVTVPVSILREDIVFTPALPDSKKTALENLGMDAAVRVVLDFKQNFWSKASTYVWGHPALPEMFTAGYGRSELNKTMSFTVFGQSAEMLSAMAGEEVVPFILQTLDQIFDGKATRDVRRHDDQTVIYELFDWSKTPFIKGGISYLKPGASHDNRASLAEPVGEVLFFAGEASDVSGDAGTLNGALLSAERAASEVVESIVG